MPISLTKFQILVVLEALAFYVKNKEQVKKSLSLRQLTTTNKVLIKQLKDSLNKVDYTISIEINKEE